MTLFRYLYLSLSLSLSLDLVNVHELFQLPSERQHHQTGLRVVHTVFWVSSAYPNYQFLLSLCVHNEVL